MPTLTPAQADAIASIADRRITYGEAHKPASPFMVAQWRLALNYHRSVKWAAIGAQDCPDSYAELVDLIGDDETYARPSESYVPAMEQAA